MYVYSSLMHLGLGRAPHVWHPKHAVNKGRRTQLRQRIAQGGKCGVLENNKTN
jgi:hypothetical protein